MEEMEMVEGGGNTDNIVCGIGTVAWALGAATSMTPFGLALLAVGGGVAMYCNAKMVLG